VRARQANIEEHERLKDFRVHQVHGMRPSGTDGAALSIRATAHNWAVDDGGILK
jgi:hypothetical protein